MKDYIVVFFVVLAISCFLNSGSYAPMSAPVGVTGTIEQTTGSKRDDNMVPEFSYTEASANASSIIGVDDSNQRKGSVSQNGSNF